MSLGGSNRLLTPSQAAEYLNVPQRSLRDSWRRWGLKAHHVGKHLRFRERDLESWLERNAEGACVAR